jgi:formylglycine-generating enzyme required for sulfatase activity
LYGSGSNDTRMRCLMRVLLVPGEAGRHPLERTFRAGEQLSLVLALCAAGCAPRSSLSVRESAPRRASPPASSSGATAPVVAPDASAHLASEPGAVHPATPEGMLLVPGGTFVMGADEGGQEDEHPAHAVTLRGFFLDRTEVTNRAYQVCVSAGSCAPPSPSSAHRNHFGPDAAFRRPDQPVSSISWDDARGYCAFAGKRLPTEAEFERAARGDDRRTFPWGNEPPSAERATFATTCTTEVGAHPAGAGPYGHLDLAGNVWEWIEDLYDPDAYRRPGADRGMPGSCEEILATLDGLRKSGRRGFTGSNPIPTECEHVLRGGAFNYGAEGLRSSNRVHHPGRFRLIMSGVRCAKDADD